MNLFGEVLVVYTNGWMVLRRPSVAAFVEQSSIPVHFGYEVNE